MEINLKKPGAVAVAMLDAVVELSDRVEEAGGAGTLAGFSNLLALHKSIQKNKIRMQAELRKAVQA